MKSSTFALVASFATTIVASPYHMVQHNERDVVVVTKTDVHVDQVQVTKFVTAGAPEETTAVTVTASSSSSEEHHDNHRNGANNHWSWSHAESHTESPAPVVVPTTSTQAPPPPPPATTPSTTAAPSPPAVSTPQVVSIPKVTSAAPVVPSAPAANNPGTNTHGMTYTAPVNPFPTPASISNDGDESYNPFDGNIQQGSLDAHNSWRKQYGADPVVWNYTLEAAIIEVNSNKFNTECIFEHHTDGYGQNIAAGYASPKAAIDGWGNEINNGQDVSSNFTKGDFSSSLHFSQLVWKDTKSIACGAIKCGKDGSMVNSNNKDFWNGWFYACDYYPAGNMGGEYTKNVGPKV